MTMYKVEGEGNSLAAILIREKEGREIKLIYRDSNGDDTYLTIRNGLCIKEEGIRHDHRYFSQGFPGHKAGVRELGPKLREKIPKDWHDVLDSWLLPKTKK